MPNVQANGIAIAYEASGPANGPPLLLIMGLGMPLVFWPDALVTGLEDAGYRVIRFDNRDSGQSTRIEGGPHIPIPLAMARSVLGMAVPSPYTLADMAADALGLLDALGVGRAHVVGASLGGMIAQVMAARWPERLASLVSIMSGTGNPFTCAARPRALSTIVHRPEHPHEVGSVADYLVHVMGVIGSPRHPPDPAKLRAHCERVARRGYDTHGIARQLLAMFSSGDRRAEVATIRVPTLVIHGVEDPLIPRAAGREVARIVPGAKLLEIDEMAHDLPDVFIPEVVTAIASHCR
jgi:proline iminopeptidase